MATAIGISHTSVQRIWAEAGLKPHLVRRFKISNDPQFEEKVTDVVGLYMNPPDRALVLCVDEKSQIQALDRTQPGLPLKKGRAATLTHDYKRHGTTTPFAALNKLNGTVISMCQPRHRHEKWVCFLRLIDRKTPKHLRLHLIVDNYATHEHPNVQRWSFTTSQRTRSRSLVASTPSSPANESLSERKRLQELRAARRILGVL